MGADRTGCGLRGIVRQHIELDIAPPLPGRIRRRWQTWAGPEKVRAALRNLNWWANGPNYRSPDGIHDVCLSDARHGRSGAGRQGVSFEMVRVDAPGVLDDVFDRGY